ncbi:APC family permease [Mycoplasma sp. SG1]|uniref:APC family permease n=1 Tax=Mycoplasma sp. SG1 TaxID=2810348 RepID=UPI00202557B3|nr:APC family permease [Mycoplasma sp. SG1]URM52753.1 APC family permease [Mycoplasma sp. SG1]
MSKKQPLKVLLIFGFNMMVGYAFLIALSQAYGSVGNWFPFMVFFCAAIAFAVGLAFAKLSNKIKGYGGSYLYVKKAFGPFWANLTGWFQYAQAPAVSLGVISGIVWATQQTVGNFIPHSFTKWTFLIAGILYILVSSVLYFGITSTKITLIILWFLKWGVLIFSIILALAIFVIDFNTDGNFIHNIFNNGYLVPKGNRNLTDIVIGTSAFFFAFGGIEGIAAISDDVENPEKNVPKGLLIILGAATIFYLVFYYIILGALGSALAPSTDSSVNMINLIVKKLFGSAGVLAIVITSIFIVSQVANKLSGRLQYGWVNTRFIAPLAVDGLLPLGLAKTNKYDQFKNAFWLDFIFTSILVLAYILIAIFGPKSYGDNMSAMLQVYTITAFVQYSLTIAASIKLAKFKPKNGEQPLLKMKTWEVIYFVLAIIVMVVFLSWYVIANIVNMSTDWAHNEGYVFQIGFFIFLIIASTLTYFLSKYLKWPEKAAAVLARKEKIIPEVEYLEKKMSHSSVYEDDGV